jgi:arylsulfatase A-like enzyme/tetratricopeptide (TPR) repeat protein
LSRSFRHTLILAIVTICGAVAAASGWWFARASAPVNGPIVLVSIDALRADRLRAYGYPGGRTPAIDALASDGLVFDRAYSHVPQTLPAHAALLTGRLPFDTGVRDAAGPPLPDTVRTLAEMLQDRGYATGGVVSSWLLRRDTGIAQGFTFFDAELPPASDGSDHALVRDGSDTEQVAERWLDSIGTSRAFLFLHLAEPHAPHTPPERFADLLPYDGEVAHADETIGRLVRYLKAHQLYDRATIILVADHGEGLGDHGEQAHGLLAYDEVLRIPLVVKLPGGDHAGQRIETPVQHIDLVPTILDLAKAPGAGGLIGRSLTPLFDRGSIPETPIYSESRFGAYRFHWSPILSIVDGQYRLITTGTQHELYDIAADPGARHNLATDRADVVARLRERLSALVGRDTGATPLEVTTADRDRFEALGYVGIPTAALDGDAADRAQPLARVAFVEEYRRAVDLVAQRQWDRAIAAFRALVRQEPQSADLWMQFARTAARGERHEPALEAYARVLELAGDTMPAHLGMAGSLLRLRRFDDAGAHARAVLADDASDAVQKAEAHEVMARVALARRRSDDARAEAALAEDLDAGRPVKAFVEGRLALDESRWADASAAFQAALESAMATGRAPLTDLRVFAAEALVRLDRMDEAESLFVAELKVFPANPRARAGLQSLYRSTGRATDAAALSQH